MVFPAAAAAAAAATDADQVQHQELSRPVSPDAQPVPDAAACVTVAAKTLSADIDAGSGYCVMCLDADSESVLLPCAHQCLCAGEQGHSTRIMLPY